VHTFVTQSSYGTRLFAPEPNGGSNRVQAWSGGRHHCRPFSFRKLRHAWGSFCPNGRGGDQVSTASGLKSFSARGHLHWPLSHPSAEARRGWRSYYGMSQTRDTNDVGGGNSN
jgi:hypothetical protein